MLIEFKFKLSESHKLLQALVDFHVVLGLILFEYSSKGSIIRTVRVRGLEHSKDVGEYYSHALTSVVPTLFVIYCHIAHVTFRINVHVWRDLFDEQDFWRTIVIVLRKYYFELENEVSVWRSLRSN